MAGLGSKNQDRVLDVLKASPEGVTLPELRELLPDLDRHRIQEALSSLLCHHQVRKDGKRVARPKAGPTFVWKINFDRG